VQDFRNSKDGRKAYLPLSTLSADPVGFQSPLYPTGATQALSGGGALAAIDLDGVLTTVNTTSAATSTMAVSTTAGHMKTIKMIGDIGDMVITVAGDGVATITLNDVGDEITLQSTGTGWAIINNAGCTTT
jgi:hypothetical protein